MRSFLKGAASYLGSAIWWITDKLWGDQLFKWARPMIPDWLAYPALEDVTRWAIAYGPPLGLFALGTFFFLRNRKEKVPKNSVLVSLEQFRRKIRAGIALVLPIHLIALGLLIAVAGVVWHLLARPQITPPPATQAGPQMTQGDQAKPSMLTGRPVSGREVVQRLERLEQEHAATVSQLATAKLQLNQKSQELQRITSLPKKRIWAISMRPSWLG
jgi:hypothetical protein